MKDLLKNIIQRQKVEIKPLLKKSLIKRTQASLLIRCIDSNLIKIITGPRRAGKSTLALQSVENKKFAYVNLEDETFPKIEDGDLLITALEEVYGQVDYYLFDEIQNFDRWEQFLNRQLRLGKNIIATGSNSKLLSDELASSLTGRHLEIEVLPLSFLEAKNHFKNVKEYLTYGGYPEVVIDRSNFQSYLTTLWDAVIFKDIAKRKKVRNISGLSNVMNLFLSSATSRHSVDSLARALNQEVTAPTIKNFIQYGIEAYLISDLTKYDSKPKNRIKSDRKAYVVDNGFYTAKNIGFSPNFGALLENAVFKELRTRNFKPNLNLFYYVTRSGYEIDFILKDGIKTLEAIQVCYAVSSLKTKERELRALKEASQELNIPNLTIVTMDDNKTEIFQNKRIKIISAEEWLGQEI